MKATFTRLASVIEDRVKKSLYIITLLSLLFWIHPALVQASGQQTQGNQSLVFKIEPKLNEPQQTKSLLSMDEVVKNDPLTIEVQNYLAERGSPLASYAAEIVKLPQWEQALGITFVESNFCAYANSNNCGSLGVGPNHPAWRRYTTAFDGFKDLTQLLEKPIYKERFPTCQSKRGVFVVPGSNRWVNGCNQVVQELAALGSNAREQRVAMADRGPVTTAVSEIILADKK